MGKYDQLILNFLLENPKQGPSIMELMKRLNIPVEEIGPTMDSLLNRRMVNMEVDKQGIERWYPSGQPESNQAIEYEPGPPVQSPEPALASKPAPVPFSLAEPVSQGVGWPVFLLGLLIMGTAAAWIGGKFFSRSDEKAVLQEKVDRKEFSAAVSAGSDYDIKTGERLVSLEAKSKVFALALDSLRASNAKLRSLVV